MTPSDDLSPPRRPIFFPVVIATAFLTIIGMTAGYVLGERHRREVDEARKQAPDPGVEISRTTPSPALTGNLCPQATQDEAVRLGRNPDLQQLRRYRTDRNTMIWICRDGAGRLYYQSRTGDQDLPIKQGGNGLFLPDVTEVSQGTYEGVAPDGNRFTINRKRLVIEFAGGKVQRDDVTKVE